MKTFLMILAAWAVFAMALPNPVHAQSADPVSIVVVDIQSLLSESKAGKNIQSQVKKLREGYQKEFKKKEDSLKKEEKALLKRRNEISEEEFTAKVKDFQKRVNEDQKTIQAKGQALDKSVNKAVAKLRETILTTVSDVAQEKQYQIVMPRQSVVIVDKNIDITKDVMSVLNKKISKIKVESK